MTDHAAKRPFPLAPESTNHPWLGLKAPDKMRDGSSPNSTVGMQSNFADGGIIGNGLTGDQVTALPSPGSAPQPQLLADGGKIRRNPAPTPELQANQDLLARLGTASRTPPGGHNPDSFQSKLQQRLAGLANDKEEARLTGKPQRKARSSDKRAVNQFADGGKVEENDDENPQIDPEDLGSGTLADAASDLTGRELQVENQIRAAQGLPPLKAKK